LNNDLSLAFINVDPLASRVSAEDNLTLRTAGEPLSALAHLTIGLAAGDESAFREFHAAYFDRLLRYLLVILRGDEAGARDALQETLLRVARHARRCETEAEFWGWLTVLARSAALDAGRRQSRYWAAVKRFMLGQTEAETTDGYASIRTVLHASLERGLEELDALDRRLIESKYFEQASVAELAAQTGLTEKAVESRLHRARQQLRLHVTKGLRDEDA
jgi:RNA polymerase sigma-70 factor (ECF subfamily)